MTDFSQFKGLIDAAQRMQEEMARIKDELGNKTVEGETGGGLVRCVASGRGEIVAVTIDPNILIASEKKVVEDLVVGAVNLALDRARELAQTEMAKAAGGLPIPPGMFGN